MRIRLEFGAEIQVVIANKNAEGEIVSIDLTPAFASSNASVVVAYGVSSSDSGRVLDRFILSTSGKSGKVKRQGRVQSVPAAVDIDNLQTGIQEADDGN